MNPAPTPRDAAVEHHRQGRLAQAERGYRELLAVTPGDDGLRHALAVLLLQAGRDADALEVLQAVVERAPPPPQSEILYALACRRLGLVARGRAMIEPSLDRYRRDAAAWSVAGSLRVLAGDIGAGETALRRALALDPQLPEVQHYLGIALHRQQRMAEARDAYRKALAESPGDAALRYNVGLCHESLGELDAAEREYEAAVAARPGRVDALARLANVQAMLCEFEGEARSVAALEALLVAPLAAATDDHAEPFALAFLPLSRDARAGGLRRNVEQVRATAAQVGIATLSHAEALSWRGPLRIGYLSPDLGEHAVGGLVRDLFAAHDRTRVEVHAYSLRAHRGATADAIRAGCDQFHALEQASDAAIAARIAADGIQVLVDLGGYTLGARPQILALRPAPVQLGYLGFIDDYAAEWIDAVLMDAHVAPPGHRSTTAVRWLEGSMLPASRPAPAPSAATRAEFGLPEGVPLLASFNNSYKIDLALLDAWLAIARAVPNAAFAVYVPDAAAPRLRQAWEARGGRPAALHLVAKLSPDRHRARSACCDLFLDAFRYQAGATAVAALEAGLPLLCREGATPLARLGVSVNRFLGIESLVCPDDTTYIARAVTLCETPGGFARLRAEVAQRIEQSGFFDPGRGARSIEAAVLSAWSEYCRGERPGAGPAQPG